MELIQALEQLSLEVKKTKTVDKSNILPPKQQVLNSSQAQSGETTIPLQPHGSRQIDDFDNSIETLLLQLSDLDQPQSLSSIELDIQLASSASAQHRRSLFCQSSSILHKPSIPHSSLDTSQEEDSDSSSQQSKSNVYFKSINYSDHIVRPLVRNLIQRDLVDITTTVRKIGQIVAIGNDIASISKGDELNLDLHYAKSLCDAFNCLYLGEPLLTDLPTLKYYNEHCQSLLNRLRNCGFIDEQPPNLSSSTVDASSRHMMDYIEDCESEVVIESIDRQFLDNQPQVANWTENRLYIENSPRPK